MRCFLLFVGLALAPSAMAAATPWEVAVILLGGEQTDAGYHESLDRNLLELAVGLRPGSDLRLAIHREFPERAVTAFLERNSQPLTPWNDLFATPPIKNLKVPAEIHVATKNPKRLLLDRQARQDFFRRAFSLRESRRLLLIYGHGFAYRGLEGILLGDLRQSLTEGLPVRANNKPLDLMWFTACFMANLEALYELRETANYFIASEDAEFAAGAPFQSLRNITLPNLTTPELASAIAEQYLRSYSYWDTGIQRSQVLASSATVSVVDSAALVPLVDRLQQISAQISSPTEPQLESLKRSLSRRRMRISETENLLDLGSFLGALHTRADLFPRAKPAVEALLQQLEYSAPGKRDAIPTQRIYPPAPGQWVVYGYDNWQRGDEKDAVTLARLPANLQPEWWVKGHRNRWWPARRVMHHLDISPFSPSLQRFHYYFIGSDAPYSPTSEEHTWVRTQQDWNAFARTRKDNPLVYYGFTQGVGTQAEKYHGLSVHDATGNSLPIEYSFLDFATQTGWEAMLLPNSP